MHYVALLRGINVGGKNTIRMAVLKDCFERLGFDNVKTYINSGNIIFASDAKGDTELIKIIEKCIKDSFGLDIPVVIRSQSQIEQTVASIPENWVNDQTMRTDVLFLWQEADNPSVLKEIKANPGVDNLIYTPGAIIWNFDRANYSKTKMRGFIGTRVYKLMTARNANTTRKIHALMQA